MAEFLEGDRGETLARDVDVQMERMESSISKQGYSDGYIAGKQLGIQEGFDNAFQRGAELGKTWGEVEGKINALIYLHPDKSDQFKLLLEELSESFTEQNTYFSKFGEEASGRHSDVSSSNENGACHRDAMSHDQPSQDSSCCGSSSGACCKETSSSEEQSSHCAPQTLDSSALLREISSISRHSNSIQLFEEKIQHILSI